MEKDNNAIIHLVRKTNLKVSVFIFLPSFLLISWLLGWPGGVIDAAIIGALALIPVFIITKLFHIDMNVYYDHHGKRITKEEYDKLEHNVDYGFTWFPWKKSKQ
jgi:hypothetical protein